MRKWVVLVLVEAGRAVRYLYFLRFALMLWLFAPLLVLLNGSTGKTISSNDPGIHSYPLRSFLSGIVTPEHEAQFLCIAFFVVSAGFVALIAARLVTINGYDRFQARPPFVLRWLLAHEERHGWFWESVVVLLSQAPGLYVLHYLVKNSYIEHVYNHPLRGIVLGSALALVFWWVLNATFYATYELREGDPPLAKVKMGENAARTILLPRWCFFLRREGGDFSNETLEAVESPLRTMGIVPGFGWLGRLLLILARPDGYVYKAPDGRLYEAHAFHIPAVFGAIFLYLAMCPLTAPVPTETVSWISYTIFIVLPTLAALWIFWWSKAPAAPGRLLAWKIVFTIAIGGFVAAIPILYLRSDPERFPPFALILIMVIAGFWALSWIAFYADRFRIPVLTFTLLAVFFLHSLPAYKNKEEHFLSTATATPGLKLKSPSEILANLRSEFPGQPVILVTSTGGGLHAAAWTANVLNGLETAFAHPEHGDAAPFHEHLLLASTVSGGSVGLLTYLDALQNLPEGNGYFLSDDQKTTMIAASQCSSLEAVTWGLVYYDLPKAVVPLLPLFMAPSSGIDDLSESPLGKDRTWALRKGFTRNLNDHYCTHPNEHNNLQSDTAEAGAIADAERRLTLANLAAIGARAPAFTMNTTTVEGGTRMLLANYSMPKDSVAGASESFPAQSFLDKYYAKAGYGSLTDLPLATAAQLSATFPYVSSAARIPQKIDGDGLHFVDGGYYDNDGTASAIEFLRSALEEPAVAEEQKSKKEKKKDAEKADLPVDVILIEIRNSKENLSDRPAESPKLWTIGNQLEAPLLSFYNAGHESVTQRNRVALDLFEKAYAGKIRLKRLVFVDNNSETQVKTDPLNWSLTPCQREEIGDSSNALAETYRQAADWFRNFDAFWKNPPPQPESPKSTETPEACK